MTKKKKVSASEAREALAALRRATGWKPSGLIGLLRSSGTKGKGSNFERELCTDLSLWWTGGARDDVFWRASGSGGRAKVRGRRGRDTMGQHGDIAATDPIGAPLVDIFTIEAKRGYNEETLHDVLDRGDLGQQEYDRHLAQTIESHEQAGSFAWLLITRRDRRAPLVTLPAYAVNELRAVGAFAAGRPQPFYSMRLTLRNDDRSHSITDVCGTTLPQFLTGVTPANIKTLATKV